MLAFLKQRFPQPMFGFGLCCPTFIVILQVMSQAGVTALTCFYLHVRITRRALEKESLNWFVMISVMVRKDERNVPSFEMMLFMDDRLTYMNT